MVPPPESDHAPAHAAVGDELSWIFAGDTVPIFGALSGETRQAKIFVIACRRGRVHHSRRSRFSRRAVEVVNESEQSQLAPPPVKKLGTIPIRIINARSNIGRLLHRFTNQPPRL
jgi:hypothetical protein